MQNAQVLVKYEERKHQNKQLFISSWMLAITTRVLVTLSVHNLRKTPATLRAYCSMGHLF